MENRKAVLRLNLRIDPNKKLDESVFEQLGLEYDPKLNATELLKKCIESWIEREDTSVIPLLIVENFSLDPYNTFSAPLYSQFLLFLIDLALRDQSKVLLFSNLDLLHLTASLPNFPKDSFHLLEKEKIVPILNQNGMDHFSPTILFDHQELSSRFDPLCVSRDYDSSTHKISFIPNLYDYRVSDF